LPFFLPFEDVRYLPWPDATFPVLARALPVDVGPVRAFSTLCVDVESTGKREKRRRKGRGFLFLLLPSPHGTEKESSTGCKRKQMTST